MRVDLQTTAYATRDGKAVMYLFCRDVDGKRVKLKDSSFRPYGYCRKGVRVRSKRITGYEEGDFVDINGVLLDRFYTRHPTDIPKVKTKFTGGTWETQLLYYIRYLVDNGLYSGIEIKDDAILPSEELGVPPRISYLDIELTEDFIPDDASIGISAVGFFDDYDGILYLLACNGGDESYTDDLNVKEFVDSLEIPSEVQSFLLEKVKQVKKCVFGSETVMLNTFIELVVEIDPDIFTGWNVRFFDLMYLVKRMKVLNLPAGRLSPVHEVKLNKSYEDKRKGEEARITGRQVFDLSPAYRQFTRVSEEARYGLDVIAKKELGFGKIVRPPMDELIKDTDELIRYNSLDILICLLLDKYKFNLINIFDMMRRVAGINIEDALYKTRIGSSLFHRESDYVLPNKQPYQEKYDFAGAKHYEPQIGLHDWTGGIDIAGQYSAIVCSGNVSPETMSDDGDVTIGGYKFKSEPQGFLPRVIEKLLEKRRETKKERDSKVESGEISPDSEEYKLLYNKDYAFKATAHSFIGILPIFFGKKFAHAVTAMGQEVLTQIELVATDLGYILIYGDTDGGYIALDVDNLEDAIIKCTELCEEINKRYDDFALEHGIKEHNFQVEFERIFKRLLFMKKKSSGKNDVRGAKKRLIGHVVWENGREVSYIQKKGVVRTDVSEYALDLLGEFSVLLLQKGDNEGAEALLRKAEADIKGGVFELEKIGLPRGLGKRFMCDCGGEIIFDKKQMEHPECIECEREYKDAYKTNDPWVEGSKIANKEPFNFDMGQGSKAKLLYLKEPNPWFSKVLCFPLGKGDELPEDVREYIDTDVMLDKVLRMKFEHILEACGLPEIFKVFKPKKERKKLRKRKPTLTLDKWLVN